MKPADIIVPALIGYLTTYIVTVWIIKISKARGFVGKDVNKPDKPEVPLLGGIGIVAGFVAGSFSYLLITDVSPAKEEIEKVVVSVLLSSLLIGYLGILDDVLNLRQSVRAFTPVFASIPLILYSSGHSTISIPFFGIVNFGIFFYIIILPAALTIAANAFNMLEGLNGLGAGMGIIMASALAYIGLRSKGPAFYAGILALILAFTLFSFLLFNKYPAKIFPGNIGTYFIGSVIGSIGIAGYMYTALFFLYIPYAIEFVLKARTKFKGVSFGKVSPDGYLYWDEKPNSLTHVVMKLGKLKEYEVVAILWGIEIIFAVLAVIFQEIVIKI